MPAKPQPAAKPPEPPVPSLGHRIDRALVVDDLVALMSEAARIADTPESHRMMDEVLLRLLKVMSIGHPKGKLIREMLARYERADRWFG